MTIDRISLSSIIPSEPSLDSFRLTFPTSIAPRYGKPPGGSFYRSATMVSNSSMLEFYLVLEATAHITAVNSPSHPIAAVLGRSTMQDAADFDPTKAFVSLTSPTFLDKDIVIVVSSRGLDKQRCVVETWGPEDGNPDGYSHAYMLTFVPRFPLPMLQQQGRNDHLIVDMITEPMSILQNTSFSLTSLALWKALKWTK